MYNLKYILKVGLFCHLGNENLIQCMYTCEKVKGMKYTKCLISVTFQTECHFDSLSAQPVDFVVMLLSPDGGV